jgi:DNA recombination protein RmuC
LRRRLDTPALVEDDARARALPGGAVEVTAGVALMETDSFVLVALAGAVLFLALFLLIRRRSGPDLSWLRPSLDALEKAQSSAERGWRDELARNRQESAARGKELRDEMNAGLQSGRDSLLQGLSQLSSVQKNQLELFSGQLAMLTESSREESCGLRRDLAAGFKDFNDSVLRSMAEQAASQQRQLQAFASQLVTLTESNERKLDELRRNVDNQLKTLQADNAARLEEMRRTVDEKLQATLDQRLGESFKLVSDRLEQVYRGLGEMQALASGVGDLKKVLANVKTRGTWGEVQLGTLLEQVLAPDQYDTNVATRHGSSDRVEFAIKLPGREAESDRVWLPVDAKFPLADYQRLADAADRGDAEAASAAARELEASVKNSARYIKEKYIDPPHTTDFAILFLPTEGLYAEVLRRPGVIDWIQRECRVVVAGPTTLWAILNSLQMGFRTLAIQRRSSEVWALLGTVKTDFGTFGKALDGVHKKLTEASNKIEEARRGSRRIERRLKDVGALPQAEAATLPAQVLAAAETDVLAVEPLIDVTEIEGEPEVV